MKTLYGAGEYQARSSAKPTGDTDVFVAFAFRLWMIPTHGDIQRRIDDISKQFTGAGWKNLPQELVDEILGYLLDDPDDLKTCSLTCKYLFGATRPLIHQRLYLAPRLDLATHPKPKRYLFSRRESTPKEFERLIDADRSGLLRYTRHLTLKTEGGSLSPTNIQEYLPHIRPITKLHGLTLITFDAQPFIPVLSQHFGMFTNTLRHLDVQDAYGTGQQLLYLICQFPLLEDLTIVSPIGDVADPPHYVPKITQSPPLRGKLFLAETYLLELSECLTALPGGLHFRSLELFQCEGSQAILDACSHTVTSVSYLWYAWDQSGSESNLSIYVGIE